MLRSWRNGGVWTMQLMCTPSGRVCHPICRNVSSWCCCNIQPSSVLCVLGHLIHWSLRRNYWLEHFCAVRTHFRLANQVTPYPQYWIISTIGTYSACSFKVFGSLTNITVSLKCRICPQDHYMHVVLTYLSLINDHATCISALPVWEIGT